MEFMAKDRRLVFCCNQHRVDHNNDLKWKRSIDAKKEDPLLQNIKVLDELWETNERTVQVSSLREQGFNFLYYESRVSDLEGKKFKVMLAAYVLSLMEDGLVVIQKIKKL